MTDSNFSALDRPFPDLAELGRRAEALFSEDPRAAMSHLRVWGEHAALELLRAHRLPRADVDQVSRIRRLRSQVEANALEQLHLLRREGNKAVHARGSCTHTEAMAMLKAAAGLARWLWKNHTSRQPPKPGTFVKPRAGSERGEAAILRAQLETERRQRERASKELADVLRILDMPQVATYSGVEAAFQALPESQQESLALFLKLFREEPLSEDWPLVTPDGMGDDKVRLVRQDELAVVVIEAPRGELLLVAHLGLEADCLRWAASRRFEVNPAIGTLQVYDIEEAARNAPAGQGRLFALHDDSDLLLLGVPAPLLPSVRSLDSVEDLDTLAAHLPPEAGDGLYYLASGHSLEETVEELTGGRTVDIDASDFAAAVHHPSSQRSFLLLEQDTDLDAVLSGDIESWRIFLHPDQRDLVRMQARGPVRVLGGAGTGKTVVLMHRAVHLLREVFTASERLLVTTFTRNLAADLEHHLGKLLEPHELERVEVVNLHAHIAALWKRHGDGRRMALGQGVEEAWREAMRGESLGRPLSFYEDEWREVVLEQAVRDERDYLKARRVGRGTPLSRAQRRQAWTVFAAYRAALDEQGLLETPDVLATLTRLLREGALERPWSAALVDEVQDLGAPELRFLRALIPEGPGDLFLVGDGHQRIWGGPVRFGQCGIAIRGRSRRLKVNYRTTARVRSWAVSALEGARFDDLDGGTDNLDGYRSLRLGVTPQVHLFADRAAEYAAIREQVGGWQGEHPREEICVAAPTKRQVAELARVLEEAGHPVTVLDTGSSAAGAGVRLATFHRLKGLEFPMVLLSHVERGQVPLRIPGWAGLDSEQQERWDLRQRCLLYVAATRARDALVVTGTGSASPFLVRESEAPGAG